jgi:hypothetical protein
MIGYAVEYQQFAAGKSSDGWTHSPGRHIQTMGPGPRTPGTRLMVYGAMGAVKQNPATVS